MRDESVQLRIIDRLNAPDEDADASLLGPATPLTPVPATDVVEPRPRLAERIARARRASLASEEIVRFEEVAPRPAALVAPSNTEVEPGPPVATSEAPASQSAVTSNSVFEDLQPVAPEILARYRSVPALEVLPVISEPSADLQAGQPADPEPVPVAASEPDASPAGVDSMRPENERATDLKADAETGVDGPVLSPETEAFLANEVAEAESSTEDIGASPVATLLAAEPETDTAPDGPASSAEDVPVAEAAAELVSLMDTQRLLLDEMLRLHTGPTGSAPVPEPLPMLTGPMEPNPPLDLEDEPPPMVLERAQAIQSAGGRALGRPLTELPSRLPAFSVGFALAGITAAAVYAWRVLG